MFRSHNNPQGAYIVPCYSYSLKTLSDLDYNFSKEQCMLPEDDHVIEICTSVLSFNVNFRSLHICAFVGV